MNKKPEPKKTMNFTLRGSGNVRCIFIHGFLESSKMWAPLLQLIKFDAKLLFVDLPGHGKSDMIEAVPSLKKIANEFDPLLELAEEPVLLIGHSLGGYVALEIARLFPKKIAGIVLFHSTANPDTPARKLSREQGKRLLLAKRETYLKTAIAGLFLPRYSDRLKNEIEHLFQSASEIDDKIIIWFLDAMKNRPSHLDFLKNRSFQLMYFEGKEDPILDRKMLRDEIKFVKPGQAQWSSNSGHMSHLESPEEAAEAINLAIEKYV